MVGFRRKDPEIERLRNAPSSLEAEQAVLGGLIVNNSAWDHVSEHLQERDFFQQANRLVFRAICSLAEDNLPFDVIGIGEYLELHQHVEAVGGLQYLGILFRDTPGIANIAVYVGIIRDRAVRRELIAVAQQIIESAIDMNGFGCDALLDEAEKNIFAIGEKRTRAQGGFEHVKGIMSRAMDRIETLYQSKNPITGLPTGWTDFDEKTAGLQRGDFIVIAGRPSMGKTSLAMNIVEHAILHVKCPVAVFSMEMPAESVATRMLSSCGRVDQMRVRTGQVEDEDWCRLSETATALSNTQLYIDDSATLSPHELRSRARRLHRQVGSLGLIVVDYLQLMQVPGTGENRATEVSAISRALKGLAKELSVPVVALSQLNRSVEQRAEKRPMMSDLRESGAIEQDADLICFIYRDEIYNPDTPDKGVAEIIIGKQRNGPVGTVRLTFRGQFTRFENYISELYVPGTGLM